MLLLCALAVFAVAVLGAVFGTSEAIAVGPLQRDPRTLRQFAKAAVERRQPAGTVEVAAPQQIALPGLFRSFRVQGSTTSLAALLAQPQVLRRLPQERRRLRTAPREHTALQRHHQGILRDRLGLLAPATEHVQEAPHGGLMATDEGRDVLVAIGGWLRRRFAQAGHAPQSPVEHQEYAANPENPGQDVGAAGWRSRRRSCPHAASASGPLESRIVARMPRLFTARTIAMMRSRLGAANGSPSTGL